MTSMSRWLVLAPVVAVGLLVLGLALNAATTIYELAHWDVIYYVPPEEAANRNGLVDLVGIVTRETSLAVSGVAAVGLLLSMVGLVRGQRWAYVATCFLVGPFAYCCGVVFAGGRGSFDGTMADSSGTASDQILPTWFRVGNTVGPLLVFGAAITVLVLLFLPPIFRRFHPPPGRPPTTVDAPAANR
ncbi:hypothetical protein AB0I61_28800 [Polymorphospora rubra]|uniref:hypothetical protein n=1 Tax=Polymorphospora rubra TaxID=338584 RepID=UPI003410B411